jgi:hypothetical protein
VCAGLGVGVGASVLVGLGLGVCASVRSLVPVHVPLRADLRMRPCCSAARVCSCPQMHSSLLSMQQIASWARPLAGRVGEWLDVLKPANLVCVCGCGWVGVCVCVCVCVCELPCSLLATPAAHSYAVSHQRLSLLWCLSSPRTRHADGAVDQSACPSAPGPDSRCKAVRGTPHVALRLLVRRVSGVSSWNLGSDVPV